MSSHQQSAAQEAWLLAFHAGERACMERCYREQFDVVDRAVGAILKGADRETVVHEVFYRLLAEEALRRSFDGAGSLAGWLRVVARNQAIDHARRRRLELPLGEEAPRAVEARLEERTHVRLTLERFRAEVLPRKWDAVFVVRFLEQQDQPSGARALGISRTTLAYQEYRIRQLFRRFILRGERT